MSDDNSKSKKTLWGSLKKAAIVPAVMIAGCDVQGDDIIQQDCVPAGEAPSKDQWNTANSVGETSLPECPPNHEHGTRSGPHGSYASNYYWLNQVTGRGASPDPEHPRPYEGYDTRNQVRINGKDAAEMTERPGSERPAARWFKGASAFGEGHVSGIGGEHGGGFHGGGEGHGGGFHGGFGG